MNFIFVSHNNARKNINNLNIFFNLVILATNQIMPSIHEDPNLSEEEKEHRPINLVRFFFFLKPEPNFRFFCSISSGWCFKGAPRQTVKKDGQNQKPFMRRGLVFFLETEGQRAGTQMIVGFLFVLYKNANNAITKILSRLM